MEDNPPAYRVSYVAAHRPVATCREHNEPPLPGCSAYQLDCQRILNSTAFRRLEGKTQVFAPGYHDHFRTRMTHTLEVAEIGAALARLLQLDAVLVRAITLAHDLGHPPFGHAGEVALHRLLAENGGFNHNLHSLRVVTVLEHPYPLFRGLNLTAATRSGLAGHATMYDQPAEGAGGSDAVAGGDGFVPTLEMEVASLADRLAYDLHDLEDAMGAEFVRLEEVMSLSLWQRATEKAAGWGVRDDMPLAAIRRPMLDSMLRVIMEEVVAASSGANAVKVSHECDKWLRELEQLLLAQVYRRQEIAAMDEQGQSMMTDVFLAFEKEPSRLPERFQKRVADQGLHGVLRDYIAGMTDRYLRDAWERLAR